MFNFKLGYIVAALFTLTTAQGTERAEYDILTLAQSWPQTSCWALNDEWPSAGATCSPCKMPNARRSWTIHGLWPSSQKGKHPSYCNDNIKFNSKLLNPALRAQLEEKWPSFNLKTNYEAFWGYEWKKHGTCALDNASINSVPKYFSKTTQLIDQYNIGNVLEESGIVPGKKYKVDDVIRVIENTLGVNVYIKCAVNPISKEQYLNEISVCLTKSFQVTNCNNDKTTSNCKSNKQVVYPENLKSC